MAICKDDLRRRKALADAMAGLIGSLVALWTFYPLDVYKTHLQANLVPLPTNLDVSRWYAGIGSKTLHSATSSFVYFFLESWVTTWYTMRRSRIRVSSSRKTSVSPIERLTLSAIAAILNTMITLPLDVLSSNLQALASTNENGASKDFVGKTEQCDAPSQTDMYTISSASSTSTTLKSTERKHKDDAVSQFIAHVNWRRVASFWKGLLPSLLLCSNPAIHYTVFDSLKNGILEGRRHQPKLSMIESFIFGLLAKLIATMVTYPLIRVKVMLMVTHRKSFLGTLMEEFHQPGIQSLYKGCNLQLAHTVLKSALLMMVREKINLTTYSWMIRDKNPTINLDHDVP